jgi:hypothetical protein
LYVLALLHTVRLADRNSATTASIARAVVMSQSLSSLRWDMTWNSYVVWICLSIECNLAIICISIPILRTLFRRYMPSVFPVFPGFTSNKNTAHDKGGSQQGPMPKKVSYTGATKSTQSRKRDSIEMREQRRTGSRSSTRASERQQTNLGIEEASDQNHDQIIARVV